MMLGIDGRSVLRRWGDVLVLGCAALIVLGPAFAPSRGVSPDLVNDLWLVRVQQHAFQENAWPSYFVNSSGTGVFYPIFLFYGGTLYAVVGAISGLFDHVRAAFFASTGLAILAAYGGMLWLSRQLGARSWRAHAPSVAFVASAYYLTNLWSRGDWPEFIGTSSLPLLVASGWRLISAREIEPVPAALLVISTVFFAGAHNVTVILGSLVLSALLIGLAIAVGRDLLPCGIRRIAAAGGLVVLAVAVNAWFLLPDLIHAKQTRIGAGLLTPWAETGFFNSVGMVFDPLRVVPEQSTTPALFVQAPDWFLVWSIAAGATLWRCCDRVSRRVTVALITVLLIVLALIMIEPLWEAMPAVIREVQFPFRLNTYVALCASGLVLVWVLALERTPGGSRRTALTVCLSVAMAISIGLAVWQIWDRPSDPAFYGNLNQAYVSTAVTPPSFPLISLDYADESARVVAIATTATVVLDPARIFGNRDAVTLPAPPGTAPFATNISAGPYAARVQGGVTRVGRTASGFAVVRRTRPGGGAVRIALSPAGGAVALGRIVSLVAIGALLIVMVRLSAGRVWTRGRPTPTGRTTRSKPLIYAAAGDDGPPDQDNASGI